MKTSLFYRLRGKFKDIGADWDQLAPSELTAAAFAHKYINPEPDRKDSNNQWTPEYCLAASGVSLNERLRENHTIKEDNVISEMVSRHSCKTDLVLYRGICEHVYDQMKKNADKLKGVDLHEKGYMQCSLVKGHEIPTNIRLRIYVPSESCVIYLGDVNYELTRYYEAVIQHGAKLKLISIDPQYINCKLLSTE